MSPPFTFGIELEFALGCKVSTQQRQQPDPPGKTLTFYPSQADRDEANEDVIKEDEDAPSVEEQAEIAVKSHEIAAYRHIESAMRAAGLKVVRMKYSDNEFTAYDPAAWRITSDDSVHGPEDGDERFYWISVEVISPIMHITAEEIEEVQQVCRLLSTNYLTYNDETSGMHVHIGQGNAGFSFGELQRMISFLYAFEPQLDMLHPFHRLQDDDMYIAPFRKHSAFTREWVSVFGEQPLPPDAIAFFSRATTKTQLFDAALNDTTRRTTFRNRKYSVYNFRHLAEIAEQDTMPGDQLRPGQKPTIEFRQHEGTLEGERAANWIKVIGGIAKFLRDVTAESFVELMLYAGNEGPWEEIERVDRAGNVVGTGRRPDFAQNEFTIIDLLEHIGLQEQADYYRDRIHIDHVRIDNPETANRVSWEGPGDLDPRSEPARMLTTWDHRESETLLSGISDAEYNEKENLRLLWESLAKLNILLPAEHRLVWDADDALWPAHTTYTSEEDHYSVMKNMLLGTETPEVVAVSSPRSRSGSRATTPENGPQLPTSGSVGNLSEDLDPPVVIVITSGESSPERLLSPERASSSEGEVTDWGPTSQVWTDIDMAPTDIRAVGTTPLSLLDEEEMNEDGELTIPVPPPRQIWTDIDFTPVGIRAPRTAYPRAIPEEAVDEDGELYIPRFEPPMRPSTSQGFYDEISDETDTRQKPVAAPQNLNIDIPTFSGTNLTGASWADEVEEEEIWNNALSSSLSDSPRERGFSDNFYDDLPEVEETPSQASGSMRPTTSHSVRNDDEYELRESSRSPSPSLSEPIESSGNPVADGAAFTSSTFGPAFDPERLLQGRKSAKIEGEEE